MKLVKFASFRAALLCSASGIAIVACGSSRLGLTEEEVEPPDANLPPPPSETDAASLEAASDAAIPSDASDEPVTCAVTPCAVELVGGEYHFCARMSDGKVWCWGMAPAAGHSNADGGDGGGGIVAPAEMPFANATQVSAGRAMTCARIADGSIRCWGDDSAIANGGYNSGYISQGGFTDEGGGIRKLTLESLGAGSITRIDVGAGSLFAHLETGAVASWGDEFRTARDTPSEFQQYVPPGIADLLEPNMVEIRARETAIAGLTQDGRLFSWGTTFYGTLGRPSSRMFSFYPLLLPSLPPGVTSFGLGTQIGCAVAAGAVYCWGEDIAKGDRPVVLPTSGGARPQRVFVQAAGAFRVCIRMIDGTVQCLGRDGFGENGAGKDVSEAGEAGADVTSSTAFARASSITGHVVSVALASQTTCVLLRDGSVQCLGGNGRGELGTGIADDLRHPNPTPVIFAR